MMSSRVEVLHHEELQGGGPPPFIDHVDSALRTRKVGSSL